MPCIQILIINDCEELFIFSYYCPISVTFIYFKLHNNMDAIYYKSNKT